MERTSFPPEPQHIPRNYGAVIYELLVGVKIGILHIWWFVSQRYRSCHEFVEDLLSINHENTTSGLNSTQSLKVVGVGYGRTGTYSLGLALTELGFPTLHTQHLYEAHSILDMWAKKVFYPAIENGTISLGEPDFDVITNHGYTATVDLPMALYFDQIKELYPGCKFILTTRESSEKWYRSFHILAVSVGHTTNICGNFLEYVHQLALYWRWLMAYISNDTDILKIPIGKPIPPPNKFRAIESYEEHNRKVRESIPSERLLEYNVKQGWEPLCEFLEINPCPTQKTFPKTNSAVSLQAQTVTVVTMFLTGFMLITFPLVAVGFRKATGTKIVPWLAMKIRAKNCKKPRNKQK